ncbi:MAG: PASTA domain-containing protein, partial [Ruminococcaceae bacterium]|nr:PASTA domain-containing protein [Oscillospiraceae bacterium]
ITEMSPGAGSLVEYGSTVVLTVSSGSSVEYMKVSDYTGVAEIIAVADVQRYYRLKSVSYEYSDEIPQGHIISQSVPAGLYVPKGSFISFTISLGKEFVEPTPEPTQEPTPELTPTLPSDDQFVDNVN